jgi:predicted nucleic acid-binding protein
MLYLDTSSLLKLLLPEPESPRIREAIAQEKLVLVSTLTELEGEVQLRGGWLGGTFTRTQFRRLVQRLHELQNQEPFEFRSLPGTVFATALQQLGTTERQHLRMLDRLHLAAMQEWEVRRLMTHDPALGQAAGVLGYEVLAPG